VSFSFDPSNGDAETRGQLTEENDFASPALADRGCGAETGPHRYPQLSGCADLANIAPAAFRRTTTMQRKDRYDRANQNRNSAPHPLTLLRTEEMTASFKF
jgi:hypothetical protein